MAKGTQPVVSTGLQYKTVAVSATDFPLKTTTVAGTRGDYLEKVVLFVATAAQAAVTIKDGLVTVATFATSPGGGIGVYVIPVGANSACGGWNVTTGSGVTALAIGTFK